MANPPQSDLESVLQALEANGEASPDEFALLVYDQLRRMAQSALHRVPPGQTLQATALVHETWLRLRRTRHPEWYREHFFFAAARAMREILIEEARRKATLRRGAGRRSDVNPAELALPQALPGGDVLLLDDVLRKLEELQPRHAQLVSLRFFAGLSMSEIAETLRVPLRSIERDWAYARAWLHDAIRRSSEGA